MLLAGDTYPVMSSKPIISGSQSSSTEEELPEGVAMGAGPRSSALVSAAGDIAGDAGAGAGALAVAVAVAVAVAESPEESAEPGGDATIASAGSTLNGFGSSLPFGAAIPAPVAGIGVALLRGNVFNGFTAGRLGSLRAATEEVSTKSSIRPSSAIMLTPRFFVIDRSCILASVFCILYSGTLEAKENGKKNVLVAWFLISISVSSHSHAYLVINCPGSYS